MPSLLIELHISPDELLKFYRGATRTVHATAVGGRTVQFPAQALQRHVTQTGIHGMFRLDFDANLKFLQLEPVDPGGSIDRTA